MAQQLWQRRIFVAMMEPFVAAGGGGKFTDDPTFGNFPMIALNE
jgi:hypothetical protein